eukprot:m.104374 g.104374  ORF g.104374 m.104374 type:complete len:51 (+) comp37203_c0_seq21:177-329(+)
MTVCHNINTLSSEMTNSADTKTTEVLSTWSLSAGAYSSQQQENGGLTKCI